MLYALLWHKESKMLVKELLEILEDMQEDREVRVCYEGNEESYEVVEADFNSDDSLVFLEFRI